VPAHEFLDVKSKLAFAGLRHADAICLTQTGLLAVHVVAGDDKFTGLVDKAVPDIDEFAAVFFDMAAIKPVEADEIGRE
jgi:hypothetical protein